MKKKIIAFRPWNILVVLAFFGIAVGITRYNIAVPDMPGIYYHVGGIIVALWGTAYFSVNLARYLKSYGWNTTLAVISESRVSEIDDSEGVQYKPNISYTYNVGVEEYSSSRIHPSGSWSSSFPSIASKPVSKYPVGKTVQIYYDPSRPEESFLERKGLVPILAGLATFVITGVVFALALAGVIRV